MNGYTMIHLIVSVLGIICLIQALNMKKTNTIPKWMLKGIEITTLSDVQGFVDKMALPTAALGIVILAYGSYSLCANLIEEIEMGRYVTYVILVVALAYFSMLSSAKREYLEKNR